MNRNFANQPGQIRPGNAVPLEPTPPEEMTQTHWAVDLVVAGTEPAVQPPPFERTRQVHALNELQALRQAAAIGARQKQLYGSLLSAVKAPLATTETVGHYAAPLSPLRDRDLEALLGLFNCAEMADIEADVKQMLLRLFPEPCWDDDISDLLHT